MPDAGVLLYPKPAGVTSHDVVASVRRRLSEEAGRRVKVGHAGTLDPFATGLLLVLVGAATRAQRFLMDLPKTYRAVARLGWTSDTGDRDGQLVHARMPDQHIRELHRERLAGFVDHARPDEQPARRHRLLREGGREPDQRR